MSHVLEIAGLLMAVIMLGPSLVLGVQVLCACRARKNSRAISTEHIRQALAGRHFAVIMPAHNEEQGICRAIRSILPQLRPGDRLVVVADNCSDHTAKVARDAGAEVIERFDSHRRGKGFALDFGVRHLDTKGRPEVVIVVDADCIVSSGSLRVLAAECLHHAQPVQALDLMHAPVGACLAVRIAELAWIVKNQVRPLGAATFGAPCQLMGTGMALPWALIRRAPLASGHIAEDLQLGLHLAAMGSPARFVPSAVVTSEFPVQTQALIIQKTRWEHGHLRLMKSQFLRLLFQALRRRQWPLLALALDLSVPPLAAWAWAILLAGLLCTGLGLLSGFWWPARLLTFSGLLLGGAVLLSWRCFAPDLLQLRDGLALLPYLWRKLPLYLRCLSGSVQTEWVRTPRQPPGKLPDVH